MESSKIIHRHPYLPRDLNIPNYVENSRSCIDILCVFSVAVGITVGVVWNFASRLRRPRFSTLDKVKLCWFVCSAIIHIILEGYFVLNHRTFPGSQTFLAQVWKEYSKGDSRYISSDQFITTLEAFAAFADGPLCLWTAVAFIKTARNRYALQLITSAFHLYGTSFFFIMEYRDNFIHGPLWHPLYFWGYFMIMNSFWVIVPILCIFEACHQISNLQEERDISATRVSGKKRH